MPGTRKQIFYPDDFLEVWKAYKAPPNASKPDSLKAWGQKSKERPEQAVLLECIRLYNEYIAKEKQYKAHLATFLRQERWEGFLDQAKENLSTDKPSAPEFPKWVGWPDEAVKKIAGKMSASQAVAWFAPTKVIETDEGVRIICPRPFHANWIRNHYGQIVKEIFGTNVGVVS